MFYGQNAPKYLPDYLKLDKLSAKFAQLIELIIISDVSFQSFIVKLVDEVSIRIIIVIHYSNSLKY